MSVKLEDVLTDREISGAWRSPFKVKDYTMSAEGVAGVRACIRLAVEKAEKVEGFVHTDSVDNPKYCPMIWRDGQKKPPDGPARHALLLLGPRYEPKPVKTAEERIEEALKNHTRQAYGGCECSQCRILRGDE